MKLKLDMPFISLNDYINAERTNKFKAAKMKHDQTYEVCYIAKASRFKLENARYNVHITWFKPNNRKDHDNISFAKKFILDGLIKAGALIDDSPKYINSFIDDFIIDKSKSYVWCIVEFHKT